jgi:hypothetical protein
MIDETNSDEPGDQVDVAVEEDLLTQLKVHRRLAAALHRATLLGAVMTRAELPVPSDPVVALKELDEEIMRLDRKIEKRRKDEGHGKPAHDVPTQGPVKKG